MAKHRTYSMDFQRQVALEFLGGETLHGLGKRHDVSRNLIRIWVAKYEAGEFSDEAEAADLLQEYEARIAALERLVGRSAGAGDRVSKGGAEKHSAGEKRDYVRRCRPDSMSVARGCRLMGVPRSTYYDAPSVNVGDAEFVARMREICDQFETYGYRRVASPAGHHRQRQEGAPADARTRPAAAAPQALRRHDRQRTRLARVPESRSGHRSRRP